MTEPHADRGPETSLWANHDWSLLWASRAVSGLGSRATDVAYPLLVLALTHSAVQAGAVMTVSELATLAGSLVGGVWVDRVNRRAVILSCEAVRCLTTCALGVLVLQGLASLAVILLAASITGLLAVPSALALSAASVRVIPPERMEESMRLQEARAAGTALAGPALAGVLFSVAAAFPFLADGVSYAATFFAGLRLRVSLALEKTGETQSSRAETATAGVRWLASHPTVAATAASLAFFTFVSSGCQVLVIILARRGGTSSAEVGAALAIAAAGGAAGVLVLRRAIASLGRLRTVLLALWAHPPCGRRAGDNFRLAWPWTLLRHRRRARAGRERGRLHQADVGHAGCATRARLLATAPDHLPARRTGAAHRRCSDRCVRHHGPGAPGHTGPRISTAAHRDPGAEGLCRAGTVTGTRISGRQRGCGRRMTSGHRCPGKGCHGARVGLRQAAGTRDQVRASASIGWSKRSRRQPRLR